MPFSQVFESELNWVVNEDENTLNPKKFSRNHQVIIPSKKPLNVLVVKTFRRDVCIDVSKIAFNNLCKNEVYPVKCPQGSSK